MLLEHLAAEKLSYRDVFRLPLRIVRRQDVHLVAFVAGWYREPLKPIDVVTEQKWEKATADTESANALMAARATQADKD